MSRSLYVNNLPPEIAIDDLIIYFQSETKSGGGDVDFDACKLDGDKAVVVFEKTEDLDRVLQRKHEIEGCKLDVFKTPLKPRPVPRKRKKVPAPEKEEIPATREKAYLGEVRTLIVRDLGRDTTDETIQMFFENEKRSGGGAIEKFERCQPTVAHITFVSTEDALRVLKNDKLELEGYLLKLVEKQPELVLPLDRKKLYVENIGPNTTRDGLMNYIEVVTKKDVCDVQFGDDRNALIDLEEEPDMKKVLANKKRLEGAIPVISNPPVCNSILITGLSKNTTKQAIEMYFENEKNGGGKVYGDILYQKDKGNAVVSFCDPDVVKNLTIKEQKLNGSILSIQQYYPFMKTFKEASAKKMKLNAEVTNHVIKKCDSEFRNLFGNEILEMLTKSKEYLTLPGETEEEVFIKLQNYIDQFTVKEIPFSTKHLENLKEELIMMITELSKYNSTVTMEEHLARIKLVGKEEEVSEIFDLVKAKLSEFEEKLNVVTKDLHLPGHKLELFVHHEIGGILEKKFNVEIEIKPQDENMTIKGSEKQVSSAEILAYQRCAEIREDVLEITEMQRHFLESGGIVMLNRRMKEKGLKGMVSLSESKANKVKVLVTDGTTVEDIHSFLSKNMFEQSYELDDDSLILLQSNKWKEFYEAVTTNTSVGIYTDATSSSEISLIGKISEVKQAFEKLNEFMRRNTIINESIHLGEGNTGFLAEFCSNDFEEIERKLEEQFVRVRIKDGRIIVIDGTKEGVNAAKKHLQNIVSGIAKGTICFENHRMQEYLASEEGKIFLAGIESALKCLIRLTKDDGESSTIIPSNRSTSRQDELSSKLLCSYETREKISLKVYKADITTHACDIIVNAANGDLKHIGGVAKSILEAGGKEIQDECDAYIKAEGKLYEGEYFCGSPGKLPCKRLIHAVGPRWDSSKADQKKKILKVTCMKVLQEAKDYRSIALPAIGSGVFGVPKDVCADIMIDVVEEFSKEHDDCSLKEIHFVNNDDASGQEFLAAFRARFAGKSSFKYNKAKITRSTFGSYESRLPAKENKREESSVAPEVQPKRKPDDCIVTKNKMKISVIVGDLSTFKADVLVNTTGENLQLNSNPCSKALSNEAGPALQAECNKIGQIKVGEVAATQGGNLLCDEVYHVICVQWNGGQGEQVLRSIIKNCLKKASSNSKKSIAFPAIGTGTLGFPHDVAAKIFFEETKEFGQRVPNCSVNDVSFVVYNQDATSTEAFQNELKKQAEWGKSESVTNISDILSKKISSKKKRKRKPKSTGTTDHLHEASFSKADGNEQNVMCIQVGEDREIEIVKGDITKETTDVIAHLSNTTLSLNSGVGKALTKSGGEDLERECQDKASSAKVTTTVLTTAGQLNAMYVAHMVAPKNPNLNDIEKCINNCLKVVSKEGCKSMSFPAVGTGILSLDHKKAAEIILTTILSFLQSSSETLKIVRIVLKDDDLIKAFQESVKQLNQEEEPGMWRKFFNLLWKTDSAPINVKEKPPMITKKLFLEIYAKNDATVNLAKEKIQKIMESQKKKEKIEDENIDKLSKPLITEITDLCKMSDIKVTIEKELNRIVLFGHSEDITNIVAKIYKILKKIGEEMKEKEKADLNADFADIVSQGVQWFWVDPDDGGSVEYDKHTNATIEKAYKKQEKSVIFFSEEEKCEIVFDNMEEKNLETSETVKVIRKDLKAEVSVPEYWEPQPRDAMGKELSVHLVSLDLNNPIHKEEYKKISDHFLQTQQSTIQQIQRIQNPALFKQYMMKKKSLDEKHDSNEKILFHGTKGDKLKEINENGLNRNYAGINGIAFGKGVYFARDASMSAGYAKADPATSKKYMYVARVAVGEYTVGDSSMLVPPYKGVLWY